MVEKDCKGKKVIMGYYYFIDVSEFNEHTLEDLLLLKKMGVRHVIIRTGVAHSEDDRLPKWVELCRLAGLSFSLYFYFYPGLAARSQVELFIDLIKQYPDVKSIWIDIEEHKNPISGVEYSPDTLNGFYKTIFTMVKAAFPDKIVGNYSGGWVLNTYIPKAWQWINTAPYWNAAYIKYYYWWREYLASMGGTWDGPTGQITIGKLPAIMEKISQNQLSNPIGVVKVHAWQCVTYIPFEELIHGSNDWLAHLDLNLIHSADWLFGELPAEGDIPMPAITNAEITSSLNVRSSPLAAGTENIIKTLPSGTRINVISTIVSDIWWAKIDYPLAGYMSMTYILQDPVVTPPTTDNQATLSALNEVIAKIEEIKARLD